MSLPLHGIGGRVVRFPCPPPAWQGTAVGVRPKGHPRLGLWHEGWGALGSGGHPCRPSSVDLSQGQQGFRGAAPGAFRPLIGILGLADLAQVQHWVPGELSLGHLGRS